MAGARARARGEAARAVILQFFSPACVAGLFLCEQAVELAGGLRVDAGSDARARSRGEAEFARAEFARAEFARVPTA
jgi:hypothetical protein